MALVFQLTITQKQMYVEDIIDVLQLTILSMYLLVKVKEWCRNKVESEALLSICTVSQLLSLYHAQAKFSCIHLYFINAEAMICTTEV